MQSVYTTASLADRVINRFEFRVYFCKICCNNKIEETSLPNCLCIDGGRIVEFLSKSQINGLAKNAY